MSELLTLAEISRRSGANPETLRFYRRLGLLQPNPGPGLGYKRYPESTLDRVFFILRAKSVGFSLDEIKTLLHLDDGFRPDIKTLAKQRLADLDARIELLNKKRDALAHLIDDCESHAGRDFCAILEGLKTGLHS